MNPLAFKLFCLCLVFTCSCFGQLQAENDRKSLLRSDNSTNMCVSIYPSRLLNWRYTGLELGFELKNNNWLSTEIRGTQLTSKRLKDINNQWNPRITGNILHIEERFYVQGKAINGPYFAFGIAQLWSKYQEEYWYNYSIETTNNNPPALHYLDTISIHKRYTDVFMKFGYQGTANRFVIGFDVGIGGRYKDVRHSDLMIEDAIIQQPNGLNFNYINDQKAYKWVFFVPISFRLGMSF